MPVTIGLKLTTLPHNPASIDTVIFAGQVTCGGSQGMKVIVISSLDGMHGALSIVQRRTLVPAVKPLTVDVGLDEFVKIPEPDITLQVPAPTTGMFAAKTAIGLLTTLWSGPAFAVVGGFIIVTVAVPFTVP